LRVAPQGTGHNAGPLGDLQDVVLLRTSAMTGVTIDPEAGVARVQAGTLWLDVVEAVAEHGLTVLHGSSPDVGVVGYSLGGGNFGIVTAIEFRLFEIETAYAGMLLWDQEHAEKVLRAWVAWTTDAPDCVTTSFRMLNLPPLPELPPFLRGRRLVAVDGAVLADDDRAIEILAALRALEPETDTFARVPAAGLVRLHLDPEGPTPAVSVCAILGDLPDAAVETFLALTGPASGSTLLAAELRQLGGALARPAEGAGALPMIDGAFVMFGVAIAATPELAERGQADGTALADAMTCYASDGAYLNFAESRVDVRRSFSPQDWTRLKGIRSAVDPGGVLRANHPVPRLYENGLPTP
jgi:FAD/FMN-containing dehydrogenase